MREGAAEISKSEHSDVIRDHPSFCGSVTARSEAQSVRLALLSAPADQRHATEPARRETAAAIWRCCDDNGRTLFAELPGDRVAGLDQMQTRYT